SYDSVYDSYNQILERVSSQDPKKKMPPGDPWSTYQIELFRRWGQENKYGEKFVKGSIPSTTYYASKIIDAPLRYQYPETLPEDFIATFYQNVKPLFTTCDQKFGLDGDYK